MKKKSRKTYTTQTKITYFTSSSSMMKGYVIDSNTNAIRDPKFTRRFVALHWILDSNREPIQYHRHVIKAEKAISHSKFLQMVNSVTI